MELTLGEIASQLGAMLDGDPAIRITNAGTLRESEAGYLTLADSAKYLDALLESKAAAAVVSLDFPECDLAVIRVESPLECFGNIVRHFRRMMAPPSSGISQHAIVHETAMIDESATISAGVVIGEDVVVGANTVVLQNVVILDGSTIGSRTTIFPNVVLYENTIVGDRCIIHAGAVLGAYGFGYESDATGHALSVQYGCVVLEDGVEIGANAAIDRGTFGVTRIGAGTKIDNLVQIAHNVQVGKHNILCAQTAIAGSATTGSFVVMGGQVGIKDHLDIPDNVQLAAQAGVMGQLEPNQVYVGTPCVPFRQGMIEIASLQRLPQLLKQVKKLQRELAELSAKIAAEGDDSPSQQDAA
ncbi:MAG: UDP-3-O-(3-hydroxymyristoyl)glucosamine N-acyltransferase [Planctomycetaceae bacterium]|nr:UDP-3-O-(3-hydroxymyristoyl)glucosamine N-acyltransferase [Planctomycetaceae bacterium]